MTRNAYAYNLSALEPGALVAVLEDGLRRLGLVPKYRSVYVELPPEKADHPGDHTIKRIAKKDFAARCADGTLDSFVLTNSGHLGADGAFACYLIPARFGGVESLSLHLPEGDPAALAELFDELVRLVQPSYAFRCDTRTVFEGITYTGAGTIYPNERANIGAYLRKHPGFDRPRMMYPVNYLTEDQLDTIVDGVPVRKRLVEALAGVAAPEPRLEAAGPGWRLELDPDTIEPLNDRLGAAGCLISWLDRR